MMGSYYDHERHCKKAVLRGMREDDLQIIQRELCLFIPRFHRATTLFLLLWLIVAEKKRGNEIESNQTRPPTKLILQKEKTGSQKEKKKNRKV